ncbi:MAG: trimethylamine methyltransferase family protein [Anaerolineales bacterium]|nr:trimethylamine methyltransferase family protein [Anaerolineales bacterium]
MPQLDLLSPDLRDQILAEALALLEEPGVRVHSAAAQDRLAEAGARITGEVARLPEALVRGAVSTAPREFWLHDAAGAPVVHYGGAAVHFDPGSAAVRVLDPVTGEHRPAVTADLVRLVQVAESLPQYDAQSTAVVCADVPAAIGDLYRLYLVLLYSRKPVVTGAFAIETLAVMADLLAAAGSTPERPRAVFDVCPSPPLTWTAFAAENLMALARLGLPAEIVSMPLAGATAPVTLAGAVVQHAAECLSGITLHQLTRPGAPIVWGGAPAVFDMRHGTTPFGAMETAMIDAAYAQVGRYLGLPTHAYLGATDAKALDAQAGLESGLTALVGALAGINMISGAGMLDSLACQSVEKLVLDAEAIAMARRLLAGITGRGASLATELFAALGHSGEFLGARHTKQWFKAEQHLPSPVLDRASVRAWTEAGRPDSAARAGARVGELLARYQRPALAPGVEAELGRLVLAAARPAGLERLPALEGITPPAPG